MIPFLIKWFSWLVRDSKRLAVIIILVFSAFFVHLQKQLNYYKHETDRLYNNCEFYKDLVAELKENSHVLLLTLDDLKYSNDSLIKDIREKQKQLKIKNKELSQAQTLKQVIKIDTTVIVNQCDFYTVIKPNSLTSIIINKKDSVLNTKLDIRNNQTIFITNNKAYRRKYKNWFVRLLHFDFKKVTRRKYQILNSNDLIKTEDVRVVEIP